MVKPSMPRLPGILHALLVTSLAYTLAHFTGPVGLGATALAVVIGIILGNLWPVGFILTPGVKHVGRRWLAFAVVLLGLRVTMDELFGLGALALVAVVTAVLGGLVLALVVGRLLGVPLALSACIGAGTGVCGVSAIAAVREAVGAKDEDVAYAVAAVTALGSVGLLLYPLVQLAWHPLWPEAYGILSGATLHSVPQAVGAAFAGGGVESGGIATVVKLGRVALLGPLALALGMVMARRGGERGHGAKVPFEVWGFLVLFLANSLLPLPAVAVAWFVALDKVLLVAALAALGLQTRFTALAKAGHRPLVVALVAWLSIAVLLLLVLRLWT